MKQKENLYHILIEISCEKEFTNFWRITHLYYGCKQNVANRKLVDFTTFVVAVTQSLSNWITQQMLMLKRCLNICLDLKCELRSLTS